MTDDDICGEGCEEDDGDISIKVNNGDGMDLGPAMIHGTLSLRSLMG